MKRIVVLIFFSFIFAALPCGAESLHIGGPYSVGDVITIQGETNFNTDNKVLLEIYPASFGPTKKYEPSMSGGISQIIPVIKKGYDSFGWEANVSSTGWNPDQYIVRVEVIGKDYRESSVLILEGKAENIPVPADSRNSSINSSAANISLIKPEVKDTAASSTPDIISQNPSEIATENKNIPTPTPAQKSPISPGIIIGAICSILLVQNSRK